MKNFFYVFNNIFRISKIKKAKNKKIKIFISVILSNTIVFADLLIIYFFTSFFEIVDVPNILGINKLLENKFLLPIIIFLRFLIIYLETMNIHTLRLNIEENIRTSLLREVFTRGNFSVADSYFYLNTLSSHVAQFYQNLAMLISSIVKVVSFSIFLIFTKSFIFYYLLFGIVLLYLPTKFFTLLNRNYSHKSYEYGISISKDLERVLDNLYLIKILKKYKDEINKFINNLKGYYDAQINNQRFGTLNSIFPSFITLLLLSFGLLFSNLNSLISLDTIAILIRLFQSIGEMNKFLSMSSSTYVHLEKLEEIEKNKAQVFAENFIVNETNNAREIVTFKNVSFKYLNSENYLFKNLNLNFERGCHTIITGPNGVGKSTLLGLVSRVFYPQKGEVITNSNKIGYVSAYPMIIRGSIEDNLLYGNQSVDIDRKQIVSLIEKFKLFDSIDYKILKKEVSNKSLSSGQIQKLSFIRTLLGNTELLLLGRINSKSR